MALGYRLGLYGSFSKNEMLISEKYFHRSPWLQTIKLSDSDN